MTQINESNEMNRKFNNRENPQVKTEAGELYLSRSCSMVGEIFIYDKSHQSWFVLLGKRGENTPDYQGFWSFPCGYLDWDETVYEGLCREVWEETGLCLSELSEHEYLEEAINLKRDNDVPLPWYISDEPNSGKQNVGMHFGIFLKWRGESLPSLSTENAMEGEADAAEWIPIEDALSLKLAFNHSQRLASIWQSQQNIFEKIAG